MLVYKLEAKNDWQKAKWYFKSMDELNQFVNVFKDHGCDIDWNHRLVNDAIEPIDDWDLRDMNKNPVKRAEANLNWAFNSYIPDNKQCDITNSIVEAIMKHIESNK